VTKILLALFLVFGAGAAYADRPVTPDERAAIERVLAAQGCKAGDDIGFIEDEKIFELDNVSCRDGNLWEYDIDASYNVIDKQTQEAGTAGDDGDDDGPEDDGDDEDGPDDDDGDGTTTSGTPSR
jgi:hypothetical protein